MMADGAWEHPNCAERAQSDRDVEPSSYRVRNVASYVYEPSGYGLQLRYALEIRATRQILRRVASRRDAIRHQ